MAPSNHKVSASLFLGQTSKEILTYDFMIGYTTVYTAIIEYFLSGIVDSIFDNVEVQTGLNTGSTVVRTLKGMLEI